MARARYLGPIPRLAGRALQALVRRRYLSLVGSPMASRAKARHHAFLARVPAYRAACEERSVWSGTSADSVSIAGLTWWIPADDRRTGGLADRLLSGHLPLADILRTSGASRAPVMIDIGANVGTTCIPRVVLGEVECVYAAEPEEANYACLVRNITRNGLEGLVLPDRVALGAVDGEAPLLRARRMGSHRLLAPGVASPKAHPVPCRRLDTWIDLVAIDLDRVGYIKCDTQGWEAQILIGAPRVLARKHIVWELEICPGLLREAGSSVQEICAILAREFRWIVDLRGGRAGRRKRSEELEGVIAGLEDAKRNYADVICYNE
jgi:FkbM family methyltransferase